MSVLNVGHGLCIVLDGGSQTFVFDCGEHFRRRKTPFSWVRLLDRTFWTEEITTIAVSHLHYDHYCGLLKPIPNVRSDAEFIVSQLPLMGDKPSLGREFLSRLMSIAPLDPSLGPLDIDLIRRFRQSAKYVVPRRVSRGDTFVAANDNWTVLWPPRRIKPGDRRLASIEKAIKAYDRAAEEHPWLADRLVDIRDSYTYKELIDELDGSKDDVPIEFDEIEDFDDIEFSFELSDEVQEDVDDSLVEAGKRLRDAANHMSLVLVSGSGIMLTGDASRSAIAGALRHLPKNMTHPFTVVVTPHHGGKNYVPLMVKRRRLTSQYWVSSAGGRLSRVVSNKYDSCSGMHYRTDLDGDIDIEIMGHSARSYWPYQGYWKLYSRWWRPRYWLEP